jgi:hypothetical protein
MQDLTLVGVTDSGNHLELLDADGRRYRLPLDDALRAALRDSVPSPAAAAAPPVELRPREIQARIRAGRTAEEIAETTGMSLERIRRFEGPVLAEREFVAQQARGVRLRLGTQSGVSPTLDELIAQRLPGGSDLEWDAWREEAGAWIICLTCPGPQGAFKAHWTYDPQLRHVSARDDQARALIEEQRAEPEGTITPRRLTPVRQEVRSARYGADRVYDVDADPMSRTADDRSATVRAAAVDLLDTLRERRGRRQRPLTPQEEALGVPDDPIETAVESLRGGSDRSRRSDTARDGRGLEPELVEEIVERLSDEMGEPPAAHPPRSRPRTASDAEVLVLPDAAESSLSRPEPADPPPAPHRQSSGREERTEPATPSEDTGARTRQAARRNRRASVPSWDDIVFGSRRE